jgi:hypothetical protein
MRTLHSEAQAGALTASLQIVRSRAAPVIEQKSCNPKALRMPRITLRMSTAKGHTCAKAPDPRSAEGQGFENLSAP